MCVVLHEDRVRAESFGADAARYDRSRPGYPDALVAFLSEGRRDVLDVGCGTGIASRQLVACGCAVLGVEVDARMAAFARDAGVAVEEGRFEDWDPGDRRFDLVVAAQSWHWVDPVAGAAKASDVLHADGRIGLFWNVARHDPSIEAALDAPYRDLGIDVDQHSIVLGRGGDDRFPRALDGLRAVGAFDAIEQREYEWTKRYTTASWLDHLPTHSDHATLPPETLAALLDGVGDAIERRGGAFDVSYRTVLVTALRA